MMQRKLNRPGAVPAQPPTQQAAAPPPAQPAQPATQAQQPIATLDLGALGAFDDRQSQEVVDTSGDLVGSPLRFWTGKGDGVARVQAALGSLAFGTPYLAMPGNKFFNLTGCGLITLKEFQYWGKADSNYRDLAAFNYDPKDNRIARDTLLTLLLLVPGTGPLPPELGPATPIVTRFRGAHHTRAIHQLRAKIQEAATAEWVSANPALANVGPRFRVWGSLRTAPGTVQSGEFKGNQYVNVNMDVRTIGPPQTEALRAFLSDPAAGEFMGALEQEWASERQKVLELIEKPAGGR